MSDTNSANLTLFYAPRSRSFTALWLLEELGEAYHLESFDLASNRHKQADYLALNPMGKVPLVMDGERPVSELGAIAIYLSDRFPKAQLSPGLDDPKRPAFLRWVFFSSAIMEPSFGEKMFNWDLPPASVAWGSFELMFETLTQAIGENTWLLGDRFSAADVLVGSNLFVGQMLGIIPTEGPVQDYVTRLQSRPAFARAGMIEAQQGDRFPAADAP